MRGSHVAQDGLGFHKCHSGAPKASPESITADVVGWDNVGKAEPLFCAVVFMDFHASGAALRVGFRCAAPE